MPHKRNPVSAGVALAAATRVPGLVSTMLSAMVQEDERGLGNWHAEWETLPQIFRLTGGSLHQMASQFPEVLPDIVAAALEAGFVRFRPVLMTALAMMIGMLPMSLGLGEGGEQNAPLGRAVIGGLLFATFATLLFVPVVFAVIHSRFTQPGGSAAAAHA